MRRLFHIPEGATEAVEVDADRLDEIRAMPGWFWLDVTEFDRAEVTSIGHTFGFDSLTVADVLAWSKFPKVEEHAGYTFVVGHSISARSSARIVVAEHDAFISDRFVVTFHQEDLPGFVWGRDHIVAPGALSDTAPDEFWARIAEVGAARYLPIAQGLETRIDALEDRAIVADPAVPAEVLALRRDTQTLRQVVGAQRDAFRTLGREELPGITAKGRRRLAHVGDDYNRLTEILDGARLLLSSVLETYRGTVAERANEVMKVLTVFSAIVLPLSLLAGIYGMNFAHMPELDWRWGYAALLGVMATVGVGLWVYFGRRGFIGGPRLGMVPGLVGKGLVEFVKLTTKPATMLIDLTRNSTSGKSE